MFRLAPVPPTLRGTVRRLVAFDETSTTVVRRRQAPTSTCTVVVGLADPLRVDGVDRGAFAGGLTTAAALTEFAGHQAGVQADLTPLGALALFGVPLPGLVDLDALGPDLARLPERLADLPSWSARLAAVVTALEGRLATSGRHPDPEVAHAWRRLAAGGGRVPLPALAADVGWSRRHLTRRFTAQVGLSPTTAGRVLRFRRAADLLVPPAGTTATPYRVADVAAVCGYADHAHLDREFTALAGCSPTAYRLGWSTAGAGPGEVEHGCGPGGPRRPRRGTTGRPTIGPMICTTLRSDDVPAHARWLTEVLGLTPGLVTAGHAELFWGDGAVLLGPRRPDDPWDTGRAVTYLVLDDPDAHHARVVAAGGEIVQGLTDQDYGSREFAVVDAEGNRWSFGTYRPVAPGREGTNRAY